MIIKILLFIVLFPFVLTQEPQVNISINNTEILQDPEGTTHIYQNGQLNSAYDDTIFNGFLNCQNGYLNIINYNNNNIVFNYRGLPTLNPSITQITVSPNKNMPKPYISQYSFSYFVFEFNCPINPDSDNYYNKVTIVLDRVYRLSFLINCDPGHRHKQFQIGYLILAALDAIILLSMAFHSQVWSLKYNGRRLNVTILWKQVLAILLIVVAISVLMYFTAFKDFQTSFVALTYIGNVIAIFFVFICFNEFFYFFIVLRYQVYKRIRVCEVFSIISTIVVTIVSFFVDNWIYSNLMAICICVASIKIFHFGSLKQAYISKTLIVVIFSSLTAVIHFFQPDRSYNDYATQLSSPLFIVVPDLVNNLFKKCSWLFILDIILPGVMLSYLRLYDLNRGSMYFGVYTLCGNITVVIATILWVVVQYAYPFSVPFSLITYLSLMLVIFLVSWTRNEWKDLWSGMFQKQTSVVDSSKLSQKNQAFSDLVPDELLDPLRRISAIKHSRESKQ